MGIDVKDKLIKLIETLGFVEGDTIFLQGTLGQDEAYPSSFFTFFNNFINVFLNYYFGLIV